MSLRAEQKAISLHKIVSAASKRLTKDGLKGTSIQDVMKDAGLTHGAFYAHFDNKEALTEAAFAQAIESRQTKWVAGIKNESFEGRLSQMAESYLSKTHRDQKEFGCAIAALASEIGKANDSFRLRYSDTIEQTINDIALDDENCIDESILFLATMTGAINLARNTQNQTFSNRILNACIDHYRQS
ncbi:MAG: TetR/AcrR family transcriptional repressor of nem operon [Candidatus Azotimanducaceae bacterium]|jgi:TetR/AcrR family transcriptional repressor of nem operon